ncbi:MAG: hypothetical protein A3F41_00480 [Coxiella sp. RIFCSPHIGHO2_12_FULL_44_14]|nr:MAG: hypothetical protein A3F41_00480 [Coxiella sp. RIFCSPHIGHO2_12_FULL_44_14]
MCYIFLLSFIFTPSWGWNTKGHVLISQIAFDHLSRTEQSTVNHYAERIAKHLPVYLEQQLDDRYRGAALFAKLTVLPDFWRGITLKNLFQRFDASLPEVLQPYRQQTTDRWHFEDRPFPRKKCVFPKNFQLFAAIATLQKAFHQTNNENSKALILLLLTHFIEDAHQPLHTFTKVNKYCHNDRGGNDYPIRMGKRKISNLHKTWDAGVGYLNRPFHFKTRSEQLQQEFAKSSLKTDIARLDPIAWVNANDAYATLIYSIKPHHSLTPSYYQQGQAIARLQITIAGYRVAAIFKSIRKGVALH